MEGSLIQDNNNQPPIPLWKFFLVWLSIGLQSFGGGATTFALIHRAVVEQHGWMQEGEFVRANALCQLTPGINLFALTILIGKRIAGGRGALLAMLGLLLPSISITLLITATLKITQRLHGVQAAIHGIIPATVGLGLLTAINMARGLLKEEGHQQGASILFSLFVMVVSGLAFARMHAPPFVILGGSGLAGAIFGMRYRPTHNLKEPTPE